MKYEFLTSCVSSDARSIDGMVENAKEISFKTFSKHVDIKDISDTFCYSYGSEKGLHLKDDYAVSYYVSKYKGMKCYYMIHSAIEYIFVNENAFDGNM